jgi:hypothetical protein
MRMASRDGVRQSLIRRVTRKVSGHGIARRSIEGAVDRVLAALPADLSGRGPGDVVTTGTTGSTIAVLNATTPDLASRTREALDRAGQHAFEIGTGTAGRHTTVAVRVPAGAEPTLERIARELGASMTVLDADAATQVGS